MSKPYTITNEYELESFMMEYCETCARENSDDSFGKEHVRRCSILSVLGTLTFDSAPDNYPKEIVEDSEGYPRCIKYKYHDWYTDGAFSPPEEEDVEIEDPNQLNLF